MKNLIIIGLCISALMVFNGCGGGSSGGNAGTTSNDGDTGSTDNNENNDNGSSPWSVWYDNNVITSSNPISVNYDNKTDIATVSVTSVAGADYIIRMNAARALGNLDINRYTITFTAWTDQTSMKILPRFQESEDDYTTYMSDTEQTITLTSSPMQYSFTTVIPNSGAVQCIISCAAQTGTFHVKDFTIYANNDSESTIDIPKLHATYDSTIGTTNFSYADISDVESVYLYENTINDPETAKCFSIDYPSQNKYYILRDGVNFNSTFAYKSAGTYYYWIAARKRGERVSPKSNYASVLVTGEFSSYASVPKNTVFRSFNVLTGWPSQTAGSKIYNAFYAIEGMRVTLSGGSETSDATVGVKIYPATNPSSYLIGSRNTYNSSWQSSDIVFTTPVTGYYIIEKYMYTTGSHNDKIAK